MVIAQTWIIVGLACIWASQAPAQAGGAKCEMRKLVSVAVSLDPDDVVVVPVTLNGKAAVMHLSLASAYSSVYQGVAESINLKPGSWPNMLSSHEYHAGKGDELRLQVDIPTMNIGELTYAKTTFWVARRPDLDDATARNTGPASAGFLGLNMFANVDVDLDLANRSLAFYSQDHCPGKVVYWSDSYEVIPLRTGELAGELYVDVLLNGKRIQTSLNAGGRSNSFSSEFARQLYGWDEHSSSVGSELGPDGKSQYYAHSINLKMEGLAIDGVRLWLIPGGCSEVITVRGAIGYGCQLYGTHPLHLGTSILKTLHLYFATKEKKLYVTAAKPRAADSDAQPVQNGNP
jgi:hypothetical protein